MNLEDTHADIILKAQRGLGLDDRTVEGRAGLAAGGLARVVHDLPEPAAVKAVAAALGLDPRSLAALAARAYYPDAGQIPKGLLMFSTPFGEMVVNSFLVWDPETGRAAAFDTGTDCDGLLEAVRRHALKLTAVYLTHSHGDHIYDLDRLVEKTGAKAWSCEAVDRAEPFEPGAHFTIGGLRVSTRLTCGHSAAGITYVISGLSRPVAVVGDALFAGSMGGGKVSYAEALRTTRAQILSLPADTLLCPGHGPLTTVALEKANNPFFPA